MIAVLRRAVGWAGSGRTTLLIGVPCARCGHSSEVHGSHPVSETPDCYGCDFLASQHRFTVLPTINRAAWRAVFVQTVRLVGWVLAFGVSALIAAAFPLALLFRLASQ
jgi:hypothetical protein